MIGIVRRRSLQELESDPSLAKEKNDYLKAWKLIKELAPSNPNSYYSIATYHGMPFKKRTVAPLDPPEGETVWDGYCQHANVLFPTWHRYYCLRLEQALQTAVPGTALHYWDETDTSKPIPNLLTDNLVEIDGQSFPNPLRHFTLPMGIDGYKPTVFYIKPANYTTKRYPFSGIENPDAALEVTKKHNADIIKNNDPDELFSKNLNTWLFDGPVKDGKIQEKKNSIYNTYIQSRDNPDYNTFSNTSSAGNDRGDALEQPHNDVHLAVGGFTVPTVNADDGHISYYGLVEGANGDMGENQTASFDPAFFLHHANVDRMFWVWQKKWGKTESFTIDENKKDPGVTPAGGQGPTPDQTSDEILSLDTPMPPFQDEYGVRRISRDCINIKQLGYDYTIGSLDQESWPQPKFQKQRIVRKVLSTGDDGEGLDEAIKGELKALTENPLKVLVDFTAYVGNPEAKYKSVHFKNPDKDIIDFGGRKWERSFQISIEGMEKDAYPGSFMIFVVHKVKGKWVKAGQKGILDRWDRIGCSNCQKRRFASIHLYVAFDPEMTKNDFKVHVIWKDPLEGKNKHKELDIRADELNKPKIKFILKSIELRN